MFEVGKTYPTVNGECHYTILKIVVDQAYPVHAYDYTNGYFMCFTMEGQIDNNRTREGDLAQPMKIGQKLIDGEGDTWYLLPNNVVACPRFESFGKLSDNCIIYKDPFYSYEKA